MRTVLVHAGICDASVLLVPDVADRVRGQFSQCRFSQCRFKKLSTAL